MNEALMSTLVPILGRALLHFLWQGAVIGLVAAVALQLTRNARPQTRYAIACIALSCCLLAPLVDVLVQLVQIDGAAAPVRSGFAASPTVLLALPTQTTPRWDAWSTQVEGSLPMLVAMWAAGACVLSIRMVFGIAWIQRLRSTPRSPAQETWQARLDTLCVRFGIRRQVIVHVVDSIDSPASAGWWRPVVLLPAVLLTRMPNDLIEALLAHELAHIRRHDYLVNLLQGVVEALLFYHPVTWWLSRRIRDEREHIADRLAAQVTGEPRRLALALSELAGVRAATQRPAPFHLAQAAHGGHLMSRIEQLVRPGRRRVDGRLAYPMLGLAAACLAFYAHAQVGKPAATVTPSVAPAVSTSATPTIAAYGASPAAAPVAATAATAAQPAKTSQHSGKMVRLYSDPTRDAYGLVRKGQDGITMSGGSDDIEAIRAAQRSLPSDFLWFRRADKAYVVVDPSIVGRAQAAWRDSDKLDVQMSALGDEMGKHGDKMDALGQQMEALSAQHVESAAMKAASQRMRTLGKQQSELGRKQAALAAQQASAALGENDAEMRKLDQQMDALSEQQDALARQMDQQSEILDAESDRMEKQTGPMEALGRQMEEAGKPMEALGKQMDALGKQQEKLVEQAEREMEKLIAEALSKGLARPAPATR